MLTPEVVGKRLELLTLAVPGFSRVAVLWQPGAAGERADKDRISRVLSCIGARLRAVSYVAFMQQDHWRQLSIISKARLFTRWCV